LSNLADWLWRWCVSDRSMKTGNKTVWLEREN
jgi:hypothetical protein